MGSRLPSAIEVLIIRPAGKRVSRLFAYTGSAPSVPGAPARKPGHSKAGFERDAVQSECSLNEIEHTNPRIAISHDFKEPC